MYLLLIIEINNNTVERYKLYSRICKVNNKEMSKMGDKIQNSNYLPKLYFFMSNFTSQLNLNYHRFLL